MKIAPRDAPLLLYVVGLGHSGSTLLELLLNRNREIAAMGELSLFNLQLSRDEKAPWIGKCSCDRVPGECPHWSQVFQGLREEYGVCLPEETFDWRITDVGREEDWGIRAPVDWMRYRWHRVVRRVTYRVFKKPPRFYRSLYGKWFKRRASLARHYGSVAGVNVVVDCSKDPSDMLDSFFLSGLRVKVIFLIRDVRGVVASGVKRNGADVRVEALKWATFNKRIRRALDHLPADSWVSLKYEDLCDDPEGVMGQLATFCEVDSTSVSAAEEFEERHTIAGNGLRFTEIRRVVVNETWREVLSAADLETIGYAVAPDAAELGYTLDEREGMAAPDSVELGSSETD